MATLTYAIEQNGLKHLELSYRGFVYDGSYVTVTLNGRELGAIPDRIALKAGQEFMLEDGTTVCVSDTRHNGIEVRYNGTVLVPYAPHQDVSRHRLAYVATYFAATWATLMAIVSLALGDLAVMSPFVLYWLFAGGTLYVLGYFVKRAKPFALIAALVCCAANTAALFFLPAPAHHWLTGLLLYQALLLFVLYPGIGAILRMTREDENRPAPPLQ